MCKVFHSLWCSAHANKLEMKRKLSLLVVLIVLKPYFNVSKHLFKVVRPTTQCQVIKNVLIHQLDIWISEFDCPIVVSIYKRIMKNEFTLQADKNPNHFDIKPTKVSKKVFKPLTNIYPAFECHELFAFSWHFNVSKDVRQKLLM